MRYSTHIALHLFEFNKSFFRNLWIRLAEFNSFMERLIQ